MEFVLIAQNNLDNKDNTDKNTHMHLVHSMCSTSYLDVNNITLLVDAHVCGQGNGAWRAHKRVIIHVAKEPNSLQNTLKLTC